MSVKFKAVTSLLAVALTFSIIGCKGGGGGGSSTGGVYFSHADLAADFVYRLEVDLGYDLDLVKVDTEQFDYIVVYDWDLGSYDAYYIGNYNPGENISNYLWDYNYSFYYDLDYLGGNDYQDPWSGIIFNENVDKARDTMKLAAVKQMNFIDDVSKKLVQDYGVPAEAGKKLARAGLMAAAGKKRGVGEDYYKGLLQEVTGTELSQWQKAVLSNDQMEIDNLVLTTANTLGMNASDAHRVMDKLFLGK